MKVRIITILIVIGLIIGAYFLGTRNYLNGLVPIIQADTTYTYDTIVHTINTTNQIVILDTVILVDTIISTYDSTAFTPLDSVALFKAFYSKYFYNRNFKDSLIDVNLYDGISQNKIISSDFSYKILRPQQIITNTNKYYSKYILGGVGTRLSNLNTVSLDLLYVTPKWSYGANYMPLEKEFRVTVLRTIWKGK